MSQACSVSAAFVSRSMPSTSPRSFCSSVASSSSAASARSPSPTTSRTDSRLAPPTPPSRSFFSRSFSRRAASSGVRPASPSPSSSSSSSSCGEPVTRQSAAANAPPGGGCRATGSATMPSGSESTGWKSTSGRAGVKGRIDGVAMREPRGAGCESCPKSNLTESLSMSSSDWWAACASCTCLSAATLSCSCWRKATTLATLRR
mmetsp:Transcript_4147/g.12366  ORF Transcript_4147/g.12366 Transcript_4147/m.12366 type:complete len:204 (+) Transcript_4147:34-645(+)